MFLKDKHCKVRLVKLSLILRRISRVSSLGKLKRGEKGRGGIEKQRSDCLGWRDIADWWGPGGSASEEPRRGRGRKSRAQGRSRRAGFRGQSLAEPAQRVPDACEKAASSRTPPIVGAARTRAGKERRKKC